MKHSSEQLWKKKLSLTLMWAFITGAAYDFFYHVFDRSLLLFFAHHPSSSLQSFALLIQKIFSGTHWTELGILCLIAHLLLGGFLRSRESPDSPKRQFNRHLGTFAWTLLFTAFITLVLKFSLARYRPVLFLNQQLYGFHFFSHQYLFNSTPSGHTSLSFAGLLALAKWIHRPGIRTLFILIAILIACSRLVLSAHYASDLILGTYVGCMGYYWVDFFRSSK